MVSDYARARENLFTFTCYQSRERHPILRRYNNDWATEELVKQYLSNRRKNHYKKGYLTVNPKYAYLKANSAKRDPSASRVKKARTVAAKRVAAKARKEKGKARATSMDIDDGNAQAGPSNAAGDDDDDMEDVEDPQGEPEDDIEVDQ